MSLTQPEILLLALLIDAAIGEPERVGHRIPHPDQIVMRAAGWWQRVSPGRVARASGIFMVLMFLAISVPLGLGIRWIPDLGLVEMLATATVLAWRRRAVATAAVAKGLFASNEVAREALSDLVPETTEKMPPDQIAKRAVETLATGFMKDVVAPVFWFLILGLPGMIFCRMVVLARAKLSRTSPPATAFGWAVTKVEHLMVWVPARLSGVLLILASWRSRAWDTMLEDHDLAREPNDGWPQSAMASALEIALGGPVTPDESHSPHMNGEGRRMVVPRDVVRGLAIAQRAWIVILVAVVLYALAQRLL